MPGVSLDVVELDEKFNPLLDDENSSHQEQVINVQDSEHSAIIEAARATLDIAAPHAERYKFKCQSHQTYASLFSVVCAASGSVLYIGGGGDDIVKIIGGTGANLPANLNFAYESYFYLQYSLKNIKQQKAKFATSILVAIVSTAPSTIASAQFKPVISHIADPCFMAVGSFPLNFYGAFAPFNIVSEYIRNEPAARKYVLEEVLGIPERDQPIYTKFLGPALGLPAGALLMGSQTGYVLSTTHYLADKGFGKFAFTSGIIANSPSLILGLFGGLSLGSQVANAFDDIIHINTDKLSAFLSRLNARDIKYIVNTALICGAFIYLASESNQTSLSLYEKEYIKEGLSLGETIDDFLLFCVKYCTSAFNALYAIKPIIAASKHLHRSRAQDADRARYENDIKAEWIRSAPIDKVIPIAETADWKKAPRKSWCGFFKKDQSDYQQLANAVPEEQNKRICLVM